MVAREYHFKLQGAFSLGTYLQGILLEQAKIRLGAKWFQFHGTVKLNDGDDTRPVCACVVFSERTKGHEE
jgi:hypothetical protein